jgi:UDP-N-acetylglucosamine 2-epimerase
MITILNVMGTRPEAIKLAPVIQELNKYPERVRSVRLLCHPAAHETMVADKNSYGDGMAATRIVSAVLEYASSK